MRTFCVAGDGVRPLVVRRALVVVALVMIWSDSSDATSNSGIVPRTPVGICEESAIFSVCPAASCAFDLNRRHPGRGSEPLGNGQLLSCCSSRPQYGTLKAMPKRTAKVA